MDDPYDRYPEDTDRRRFVKGVVGAGALSGVIATTAASVDLATTPAGAGGGPTPFRGAELVSGPAPRGMPQIPVELDDEGYLRGVWPEVEFVEEEGLEVAVAQQEMGGETYDTAWFQYCGTQENPAIEPDSDRDNYFRYRDDTNYEWQTQEVEGGDRVHIDHFEDYQEWGNEIGEDGIGKPANVTWRSTDLEPRDRLPVQLIRSPLIEEQAEDDEWLAESTTEGFVAIHNQCTHFCCVPAYKNPGQPDAAAFGGEDRIYCQCHQSVYDPFSLVQETFVALPRPD